MTKNTLFFTASFAALFAIGCNGDDEVKDSGDSGITETGDDDDDDTMTIPNMFDDTTLASGVDCSGATVTFSFDFLGEAAEGLLDAADSANDNNWNDYHTLDASGITADGGYTLLSNTIDVGVAIGDWADGVGTIFTCEDHYNSPEVMTYVARAYDLDAMLADCVAWGDDAVGMLGGSYVSNNAPLDQSEFDGCRTISAAK